MAFYMGRIDDSDGNDNQVFDVIVEADSKDAALDLMEAYVMECYPDDEKDGSGGTSHPCDCECDHGCSPWDDDAPGHEDGRCGDDAWECSHGGVLISDELTEYPDYATAYAHRALYYPIIDLTKERAQGER